MKISEKGLAFIKSLEGLRLKAYKDGAGVWTIGYGSTRYADEVHVKPGDTLADEQQASTLFLTTLSAYENAVNQGVRVPITQNQFDALVSITYNVGTGIMRSSTLVERLNLQDYEGAANQFLLWDKITDPVTGLKKNCPVLMQRRKLERNLFITPDQYAS